MGNDGSLEFATESNHDSNFDDVDIIVILIIHNILDAAKQDGSALTGSTQ
jgi:hypothetical protein